MLDYRFCALHQIPPQKNWQLNEIIHFLVWCHPKIAIIATAWRLWSETGKEKTPALGEVHWEEEVDWWMLPAGCVLTLCLLKNVGRTEQRGVRDHFLLSAQRASKDKTGLDVVRVARLMTDCVTQQQRLRVLQFSVWECTQMHLCNHVEPESHRDPRARGDSRNTQNLRNLLLSEESTSLLSLLGIRFPVHLTHRGWNIMIHHLSESNNTTKQK